MKWKQNHQTKQLENQNWQKPPPLIETWNCTLPVGAATPLAPATETETVTELPNPIGLAGEKVAAPTNAEDLFTVKDAAELVAPDIITITTVNHLELITTRRLRNISRRSRPPLLKVTARPISEKLPLPIFT